MGNRLSVYEVVGNGSNQGVISGGRGGAQDKLR